MNSTYIEKQLDRYQNAQNSIVRQDSAHRLISHMTGEVSVLESVKDERDAIDNFENADFDFATLRAIEFAAQKVLGGCAEAR